MKVLDVLIKNKGEFVSGENLARELNVSRTAVWKQIKTLQKTHDIEAVTNKGYRLSQNTDIISHDCINRYLKTKNLDISIFDEVKSTNILAKELAENGAENHVVIANTQTDGKGRKSKSFFSPHGGSYFSIVVKPQIIAQEAISLTALTAVATCEAINEVFNVKSQIKWVNDIYLDDKKVCGILCEGALSLENNMLDYVVVGVGVNVYNPENGFPSELSKVATSLAVKNKSDLRSILIAKIIDNFFSFYEKLKAKTFLQKYKDYSMVLGKNILINNAMGVQTGKAVEIDDNCNLVAIINGEKIILNSGEVSIVLEEK